jgi:hypothetical protein
MINERKRPRVQQPEAVNANNLSLKLITLPAGSQGLRLANLVGVDEICSAWGVSRRFLEKARKRGEFPAPDVQLGRHPKWRIETVNSLLVRQNGEAQG